MYQYVYFTGAMIVFPLWLLIVLKRRDLFFQMIIIGAFTAVSALFFEFFWFFKDYWRPLKYVSVFSFIWQESLFALLIGGIAVGVPKLVLKTRRSACGFSFVNFILPGAILILSFVFVSTILGFNSLYACYCAFGFVCALIFFKKPDLIKISLISGAATFFIAVSGYQILLKIYPALISDWWMLENISGILFIGIPLEEYVWFFLYGAACGPLYDFWMSGWIKDEKIENRE
jgi:hypothetical protein